MAVPVPEFKFDDVQTMLVTIKKVDPSLRRRLISELQRNAKPFLSEMNFSMNNAFLRLPSGLDSHEGRTKYNRPIAKASAALGGRKNSIFLVKVGSNDGGEGGFMMTELAGTKNKYQRTRLDGSPDRRGPSLIRRLDQVVPLVGPGKGGRIAFRAFLKVQPALKKATDSIIQRWIFDTNKDLKKGRVPS
jgi:hypothetical protein